MNPYHPKCGKTFPGGSQAGHCGSCCETFIGLVAFEAHRVGSHSENTRTCEIQPYTIDSIQDGPIRYGHWQDERGYWHYGKKLSKDEKEAIWGREKGHGRPENDMREARTA